MQHVQKLSRFIRIIFQIFLIVIPLFSCFFWLVCGTPYDFLSASGIVSFSSDVSSYTTQPLTYGTKIVLCIIDLFTDCIYLYALMVLIHLFRNYERCEIFSLNNVICYRKLSYCVFYWIAGSFIQNTLFSVIVSFHNPVGQRVVNFGVSDSQVTAFVFGLVILIISYVMKEGYLLADENKNTI